MNPVKIELFQLNHLWHDIYSPQNPDLNGTPGEDIEAETPGKGPIIQLAHNYDYETLPDNNFHFYSDITLRLPNIVSVTIRSQYKIISEEFEWDNLFSVEIINAILSNAIDNTIRNLTSFCKQNLPELSIDITKEQTSITDETINVISKDVVDTYFNYRKMDDINNAPMLRTIGLVCPDTNEMKNTLNLTFHILDQILFNNLSFQRLKNQDVFFDIVPMVKYHSLRLKCLQIQQQEVELSQVDVHFFLRCVDCAVQMLLGDKAEYLIRELAQHGVNDEIQSVFFKNTTRLFDMYANSHELEEKHDWMRLIS